MTSSASAAPSGAAAHSRATFATSSGLRLPPCFVRICVKIATWLSCWSRSVTVSPIRATSELSRIPLRLIMAVLLGPLKVRGQYTLADRQTLYIPRLSAPGSLPLLLPALRKDPARRRLGGRWLAPALASPPGHRPPDA